MTGKCEIIHIPLDTEMANVKSHQNTWTKQLLLEDSYSRKCVQEEKYHES